MRFGGGMKYFFGGWDAFWGLNVFSGGCSNAGGTLSAPRNCKSLYVVGPEVWRFDLPAPRNWNSFNVVGLKIWRFDLPAPRNWKSFNVVGPEIWTINLSAPRELKSFNLVGQSSLDRPVSQSACCKAPR